MSSVFFFSFSFCKSCHFFVESWICFSGDKIEVNRPCCEILLMWLGVGLFNIFIAVINQRLQITFVSLFLYPL